MNEYCTKKSTVGHVTQKYVAFPLISAIPSPQISVSPLVFGSGLQSPIMNSPCPRQGTVIPVPQQSHPPAADCSPSPSTQALDWTTVTVPDWDCVCLGAAYACKAGSKSTPSRLPAGARTGGAACWCSGTTGSAGTRARWRGRDGCCRGRA